MNSPAKARESSVTALAGGGEPASGRRIAALRRAVFSVALAIAFVMVFVVWRSQSVVDQTHDLYRFGELGRNLAQGHGFRLDGGPLTIRRGPGYPAMIAVIYLVFGIHPTLIQVAQCLLAAGSATLVFDMGRRVFSTRTGLIAAGLVALHPMVMRYVPDIQVETTLTFLYTLTIYRTICLLQRPTVRNGVWVGVAAGAAAMVKAVALPYVFLFAIAYLIWRARFPPRSTGVGAHRESLAPPSRGRWFAAASPIAAMFVAMAVVILPWTYRNYRVTGEFVLISGNASGEFLRGYVFAQERYYLLRDKPYEVGENEANAMQRALFARKGLVWERDERESEIVQSAAAREKLRSDPAAFVGKFGIGLFMFWYVVTTRMNSLVIGSLALAGWILTWIGWNRVRGDERLPFLFILLPIVSINVFYAAVLALGRYSAPSIPALMILAAYGIDSLMRWRDARVDGALTLGPDDGGHAR